MATHDAVVIVGKKKPFEIIQTPTIAPKEGEIRIRNLWAASTPLDLHRADGNLLINTFPAFSGSGFAGEVVEVHPSVTAYKVGDRIFGFGTPRASSNTAGHQVYITTSTDFVGKVPEGMAYEDAVTTTGSAITVFHTMVYDFQLDLPWPKPADYVPKHADDAILIWGGSGSVGMFALQIFRYFGYRNIIATASARNHAALRELGATELVDYREPDVVERLLRVAGPAGFRYVFDCIGHQQGTVEPIAKLAARSAAAAGASSEPGCRVAIVLPVVMTHSDDSTEPEYEMDVARCIDWAPGVAATGIRAHFYTQSELLRQKGQPEIIPELLRTGAIKTLPKRIVPGDTLLQRATNALDILRAQQASAERLVWRVAEE